MLVAQGLAGEGAGARLALVLLHVQAHRLEWLAKVLLSGNRRRVSRSVGADVLLQALPEGGSQAGQHVSPGVHLEGARLRYSLLQYLQLKTL